MIDEEIWVPEPATVIQSKSGRLAVIVGRGRGYNPGKLILEIRKDGNPADRPSYWIKGSSPTWRFKGKCVLHRQRDKAGDRVYFSDFTLYETEPPHNPGNTPFHYVVELSTYDHAEIAVDVMAQNGEEARDKVLMHSSCFGIAARRIDSFIGSLFIGVTIPESAKIAEKKIQEYKSRPPKPVKQGCTAVTLLLCLMIGLCGLILANH